jgi:hypothetical protein
LFSANQNNSKVFLFSSPSPGDGKSTISSNLAVSLAQAKKRVVLVDADFRRPRVQQNFGIDIWPGCVEVLEGTLSLDEAIRPCEFQSNLFLLTSGGRPKDAAELIALAKQQPGKIMIGSAGNGTVNHLVGEMLNKAAGIDLVHVPYKGAAAAVTDLVGGQVQVSVQSLPSSISFIRGGRIKVLGVVNEKRLAALPNSPLIQDVVPGLAVTPWYGVFAPAGTPRAIVSYMQMLISQALDTGEVKEKLANVGAEPYKLSGEQFMALIRSDLPRWAKAVKDSGASID